MKYWYQKPHSLLARYIQTVLVLEGNAESESSRLPLVTNGINALLCRTEIGTKSNITLYGQSIPDEKLLVGENASLVAFFFKPYALGTIFKLSAHNLKNKPIDLYFWQAQKATAIDVQLFHCRTSKEKIEVLNLFIIGQLQSNQSECEIIQFATDQLMENPKVDVLAQLLNQLNLTERTFQRIFKKYVGVSPNQYRRLCQFYFAFAQLKGRHFEKLNDIAYANGYFDQSHFIRSFKEFTDSTPNAYLTFGLSTKNK